MVRPMTAYTDLDPRVASALAVLEQALQDLRGAVDAEPADGPAVAELGLLRDALEQLVILAGGSDG
jgi:hypothetical protein